jgi:hypothetical protein
VVDASFEAELVDVELAGENLVGDVDGATSSGSLRLLLEDKVRLMVGAALLDPCGLGQLRFVAVRGEIQGFLGFAALRSE